MGRKKTPEKAALQYQVKTRVTRTKYQELKKLLDQNPSWDMSTLVRDILYNRPVRVYTTDRTLDNLMEELAALRTEIRAIGVNINQITRLFNTYPDHARKQFYAKTAFSEYQALQPKIERMEEIISKLAKKWLSA